MNRLWGRTGSTPGRALRFPCPFVCSCPGSPASPASLVTSGLWERALAGGRVPAVAGAACWPEEQGRGVHTVFRPGLKTHPWDPVLFLLPVCHPDERTQQRAWRPSDGRVTRRKDPGSTGVCVEQSAPQPARPGARGPSVVGRTGGALSPAAPPSSPPGFIFASKPSLL